MHLRNAWPVSYIFLFFTDLVVFLKLGLAILQDCVSNDSKGIAIIVEHVAKFGKLFNHYSMKLLNSDKVTKCLNILSQTLNLLKNYQGEEIHVLIGLTLNNLSCAYKRNGQIAEA